MSKMKIAGLVFMASFLSISVFWVGVFPHWSIATQSIARLHDSPKLKEDLAPLPNSMAEVDETSEIDSKEDQLATSPSSALLAQGKYPEESSLSQPDQSKLLTEKAPSQSEAINTRYEDSQSSEQKAESLSELSSGTSLQEPAHSNVKPNIIISGTAENLSPTPLPGQPGTPIRPYYDEAGNPPTAPGLAMRQRKFQSESEKMAYLTFDDGPYPSTTPKILDILAKENVRATFFNIGQQVELYPDLLKAVYEQDHVIGNHTYSHNMAEVYKRPKNFLDDVRKAEEIIYHTIGIRPQIVRAPGGTVGHFNIDYFNTIDAAGYLMEDWNVDPGDTDARLFSEDQLIRNVEEQIQGKTRVVILLHDLVGKNTTIDALPEIIELLKKQGFSFGVLGPDVLPIVFSGGLQN
ncbi:polysaccharide deacetylase family protein [Desulfosporosinus nitroreducens]|uniref:Polysaccharide deacetylase family protein n=1 Tax=Desulfosporosinus nitroreducens TaxID=2018668 RepID=A0ABT8QWP0_9FIRM|nr:polysaccharide deacetylase family protein [Desulfosporosinus nitroreducens]MDO0825060.1 polysaccharide deacetylase family protein [Desulfosporosinus nitroreducens]